MVIAALAALALLLSGPAEAGGKKSPRNERKPNLDTIDPVRFELEDAIVEHTFVTARDGLTQLAVDVIRPDTEQSVPTIFFQSPYYNTVGRGYKHERKLQWGDPAIEPVALGDPDAPKVPFPEWYDEYFVPRGYAVVMQDMRGTRNSSGCQVYGGPEEGTDAVDVIEWIAEQSWSNGAVGMTGGSYDGTVAIAAASMAPEPLKAIIPIRAIDRWYDYHFFNGLQSANHLATPWFFTSATPLDDQQNSYLEDMLLPLHVIERKACAVSLGALVSAQYSSPYQDSTSDFWAGRDFLKDAESITAATFIIHGIGDANVKPTNAGHLWAALPRDVPKKLWWARMAHADPKNPEANGTIAPSSSGDLPFPFDERFVEYTHRWFAQYLKGIDTGVLNEPPVSIQSERGKWFDAMRWPPKSRKLVLYPTSEGTLSAETTDGTISYPNVPNSGQVSFVSEPLRQPIRIAGQAVMHVTYTLAQGGDTTFAYRLEDISGTAANGPEIASGYARGAYRDDIEARGPSYPSTPSVHTPGTEYTIEFPFMYQDYVVAKGHRIRLIMQTTDGRVLGGGIGSPDVTVSLATDTFVTIPVAVDRATDDELAGCLATGGRRCKR
ncbi:MAG: CocE/NonD family hydrolase [Actinomycetota bacterium]